MCAARTAVDQERRKTIMSKDRRPARRMVVRVRAWKSATQTDESVDSGFLSRIQRLDRDWWKFLDPHRQHKTHIAVFLNWEFARRVFVLIRNRFCFDRMAAGINQDFVARTARWSMVVRELVEHRQDTTPLQKQSEDNEPCCDPRQIQVEPLEREGFINGISISESVKGNDPDPVQIYSSN